MTRRSLHITVALAAFTAGFLTVGRPSELAYSLPAALAVFVILELSGRLRGATRGYDLHHFKVAAVTIVLWIPLLMFYAMLLAPPSDFHSCVPEWTAEDYEPATVAESSPPAYTVTPVGDGEWDGGYRCGKGVGEIAESDLIWAGVVDRKALVKPEPFFPLEARAADVEGTLAVLVSIDGSGIVTSAKAVSGHSSLRRAAADAACYARFSPIHVNGPRLGVRGILTYDF